MKYLPLLSLLIILPACASPTACGDRGSQRQMTRCAEQNLAGLEAELQTKHAKLSKIIGSDHLDRAISAWTNYRDAHCASTSNLYSGGSLHGYVLAECKSKLTRIRIDSLDDDYRDTVDIIIQGSP